MSKNSRAWNRRPETALTRPEAGPDSDGGRADELRRKEAAAGALVKGTIVAVGVRLGRGGV